MHENPVPDIASYSWLFTFSTSQGLQNGERGEVGDIRLIGDIRNGYGAVQLRDEDEGFIGICPDDGTFGTTEANIVCRQLGYDSGTVMEFR